MKISKIAVVVLFAAGFLTTSASASMATSCAVGFEAVGMSCEPIEAVEATVDGPIEAKPIDSCWTNEDGSEVCARGIPEPMPVSLEDVPVDGGDCTVSTDADGNELTACYDAVPYEVTGEEGEVVGVDEAVDDGTVDETLMMQSGVAKSGATPNDQTASNTLAAFGVLVGAVGALGIALSREKEAK